MKPYKPILYHENRNEIPYPYHADCRGRCPPVKSQARKQEEAMKLRMDSAGKLQTDGGRIHRRYPSWAWQILLCWAEKPEEKRAERSIWESDKEWVRGFSLELLREVKRIYRRSERAR